MHRNTINEFRASTGVTSCGFVSRIAWMQWQRRECEDARRCVIPYVKMPYLTHPIIKPALCSGLKRGLKQCADHSRTFTSGQSDDWAMATPHPGLSWLNGHRLACQDLKPSYSGHRKKWQAASVTTLGCCTGIIGQRALTATRPYYNIERHGSWGHQIAWLNILPRILAAPRAATDMTPSPLEN